MTSIKKKVFVAFVKDSKKDFIQVAPLHRGIIVGESEGAQP